MLSLTESEAALRSGTLVAAATRDVVIVDGPEAASYLHGQVSQNIEGLAVGASGWTFLLEPTGRITAWARVTRASDEAFWFDVDTGAGAAMLARLERFKLRTKATFTLVADCTSVAVRGATAPSVAELATALAGEQSDTAAVVIADLGWPTSKGADIIGLDAATVANLLGCELGDPSVVELERIEAGRPAMGREFGEKTIPAETGVVNRSADFTKGCYVGQELVARVDSRGSNTPRTVYPGSMPGAQVPEYGAEVTLDGAVVGFVTSASAREDGVAALVSVKRGVEVPVTLQIDMNGESAAIDVAAVHWS